MSNRYDKMEDYVLSVFSVFKMITKKSQQTGDRKLKMIALVIFNYVRYMAKENDIILRDVNDSDTINLIPIFEYIAANNVELYDFSNINMNDVDVTKKNDLERYVLTHIYYITQTTKK